MADVRWIVRHLERMIGDCDLLEGLGSIRRSDSGQHTEGTVQSDDQFRRPMLGRRVTCRRETGSAVVGDRLMRDRRAVSPLAAYTLTLGVTALLIGGLFIAAGGFVSDQREVTAENELEVLGQQVSADIAAADRLNRTSNTEDVAVSRSLPISVVGANYRINVIADGEGPTEPYLELVADELDVRVTVGLAVKFSIAETTVDGGDIVVEYDTTEDELVVRND